MSVKSLHALDNLVNIIGTCRTVHLINIGGVYGVEFQNVIVHAQQSIVHLWTVNHGGVAEHADLCLRTVLVAQTDGVVDNLGKMGMAGGFAIAGKGQHVW